MPFQPMSLSEILVENSTFTSRGTLIKRLVKELGWPNRCMIEGCPNPDPEWNGKPLTLQLDHINGVNNDHRIENLRIICPNCHTQTETFCGKKAKGSKYKKIRTSTSINPVVLSRIKELAPQARLARHQHQEDDAKVIASRELDGLLLELSKEGYTYNVLSDITGIKIHSVRSRVIKAEARATGI